MTSYKPDKFLYLYKCSNYKKYVHYFFKKSIVFQIAIKTESDFLKSIRPRINM